MSKIKSFRKRRVRRQNKQAMKYGKKAKPTHKLIPGRTGNVHYKKRKRTRRKRNMLKTDKVKMLT